MKRRFRIKCDKLLIFFDKDKVIFRKRKHVANTCGGDSPDRISVYRIVGHERRGLGDRVYKAKKGRLIITIKNDIVSINRVPMDFQGGDKVLIFLGEKEIR